MTFLKTLLRKFNADERGVITLEVIILTPLMVLWIIASNAFFDGFKTYLRAGKATYTAVDLISRQGEVGPNYVANVGSIFEAIVDADGAASTVVISSIGMTGGDWDSGGTLTLDWSRDATGGAGIASPADIPTQYIPNLMDGEHIVLIQAGVPFIPKASWGSLTAKTFTNTLAVTPRYDVMVGWNALY